jgi:hypothetical protein
VAKTAVFHGVSAADFRRMYYPTYQGIVIDNLYGTLLYAVIGIYRKYGLLTSSLLRVIEKEQHDSDGSRTLSSILWDMFTGNERYKQVFLKSLTPSMHIDMWEGLFQSLPRRSP